MSLKQLLIDYRIPFSEQGKNIGNGWIGLKCPFCDDHSNHLGLNLQYDFFSCWRCGWHPTVETISKLIGVDRSEAFKLVMRYKRMTPRKILTKVLPREEHMIEIIYPDNTTPLQEQHKKYLIKRKFDADYLEQKWGLMGTGPNAPLKDPDLWKEGQRYINFRHRIIIPIRWNGKVVSFTSRDITGKAKLRYINCPARLSIIDPKKIIYGIPEEWGDAGICVEGPFDVWRFGPKAFATLGIQFTLEQVHKISNIFKKVAVIYDNDREAQSQARKLASELKFRGVESFVVRIKDDPASLTQKEADDIVEDILKIKRVYPL